MIGFRGSHLEISPESGTLCHKRLYSRQVDCLKNGDEILLEYKKCKLASLLSVPVVGYLQFAELLREVVPRSPCDSTSSNLLNIRL
ncbi:hypothetical protein CANCADRAFT_33082 [Tortispora caseinolytica NRRL Y-17796]|uniref:Uncharacterized protein n=1 Tax=Tortispora caseinolytica NRRL Y-17796 TaxID=767744 RepID=A0A1E4T986_9ASCO|nr:hypothetical protein CANCADRAFT_33082 [Tortispora caseinolytica NRRL Y-17796]